MAKDLSAYIQRPDELSRQYEKKIRRQWDYQKSREQKNLNYQERKRQAGRDYLARKKEEYAPKVPTSEELATKRQFIQQKYRDQQAQVAPLNIPPATTKEDKGALAGQGLAEPEESPQPLGGIRGKIAQAKQKSRLAKEQASKIQAALGATGEVGLALAQQAVLKLWKTIWTAVHEFLEDTALSFIDLMIISGPICLLFFSFRVLGMLSIGRMLTIRFKGIELPIIPMFSAAEILPRFGKTALIALIAIPIWFIIIMVIWILVDPHGAVKVLTGSEWAAIFTWLGVKTGITSPL